MYRPEGTCDNSRSPGWSCKRNPAADEDGKPLSAVDKQYAGHDFMPEMRKGLNKWATFLHSSAAAGAFDAELSGAANVRSMI